MVLEEIVEDGAVVEALLGGRSVDGEAGGALGKVGIGDHLVGVGDEAWEREERRRDEEERRGDELSIQA